MRIGTRAPKWNVPCFLNGRMEYRSLTAFQGNQLVLCCVPSLEETHAWLVEPYVSRFRDKGSMLAVLVPNDDVIRQTWVRALQEFDVPFFMDPLRRLGRTLGLSRALPAHRCETLFFDQDNCLHFRLFHDLNLRGITRVLEVAESDFCQRSEQEAFKPMHTFDPLQVQHSGLETPSHTS